MGGAVAINMHRKDPSYWDGAILMAPLCKIADEMKPGRILLGALEMVCRIVPTWKVIPTKDILDKVCKDPDLREQIRSNEYIHKENIPLKTGHQLLVAAADIENNLHQVTIPFLVLHGGDDIVTNPSVSKLLYEKASSHDKTLKIYPGMWHALTGEAPEDVELVFSDVISWLDQRSSS
ncbi:alpha/beta-Hydrolases superfamily protein [Rhynchospora pubera]|uniref:Alpha/beta-Hydrolases superfamily protein n=1 Tax=Rhynchospora pubera TaxID=906938 RepID=A0AAV8GWG3_9POAL|nr:alpha/beta-Hydrolases superfamily protein [Rhynchospora pubera]KAJ4809384.1 alpha/beta-Hydrolases superfamily protein [Rhynchospora pubera]